MADFCSFCYYGDMNYQEEIYKHIDKIKEIIEEEGSCSLDCGLCEGCCSVGIIIDKHFAVEIRGGMETGYIGNINPKTYELVVDEDSDLFKRVYLKKKERSELEYKNMKREHEAVKHIAYGLYMISGTDGLHVAKHECIHFDEFKTEDYKELTENAWDMYMEFNNKAVEAQLNRNKDN